MSAAATPDAPTFFSAEELESKIRVWTSESAGAESDVTDMSSALQAATEAMGRRRWPIARSGEREPIIWPVRLAVAKRDNYTCRKCHRQFTKAIKFEIDHIVPWSAGGPDTSDNLRFLCAPCNQNRSNMIDGTEARAVKPATWWCVACWSPESWPRGHVGAGTPFDPNVSRRVLHGCINAYCAHCGHLSRTDMTL